VNRSHPADDGTVFDDDMAGQHRAIGHDDPIADLAVVGDVTIGHDETLIADPHRGIFLTRGIDRYKFPNFTPLSDGHVSLFAAEF
jgi:hypothetical protein